MKMAASNKSASAEDLEAQNAFVFLYDRREKGAPEKRLSTGGLSGYADFKKKLTEELNISRNEKFVIATTNREEINDDASWDIVDRGDTLYILHSLDQELCAPAEERVNYLPHYDTIVKGGMYEYYASEGQNPLPYAFAELIDNALAATRNNVGHRSIEIRLHLEESTIYVIDNGKGMSPRQLNNWAIYRLSKFIRKDKRSKVNLDETVEEEESFVDHDLPRSLNSDISYFGVGGKQAVFFIGNATRMISRPQGSKDVHELTISKEEFEKKEKNHESIYSGFIRNRKPGDASHVAPEDEVLRSIIEEEEARDSFTVVMIQGISKDHLQHLKERMNEWTRQLAHIYHYYLHGPMGNAAPEENIRAPSPFKNIDILVKMWLTRGQTEPRVVDLREVEDDMQTLFVRGASSVFEFKAHLEGTTVEGVLRYHPFLYDRETYPVDQYDRSVMTYEDEHGYAVSDTPARGRRSIFECFWNGRLIPYSSIDCFEWCDSPKKAKTVPMECFNRVSGVLWTDDQFQVSTNKLTFIDLELRLRDKLTSFTRIVNGQEKRTAIEKEFLGWLRECHELHDKQILFSEFIGQVTRPDLPRNKQTPWAAYKQVEWDGKIFKAGQMVKIARTLPTLVGSINRILLYGDHAGNVYATGGDLEVSQEPKSLYNEVKIVPLSKLDRLANAATVRKYIEEEEGKLPSDLELAWPDGNMVNNNEKRRAGKTIGDMKVEILNKRGDKISKLPGKDQASKKLLVELKVIWYSAQGNQVIVSHISQHGKSWPYWFRKMENIQNLGQYTLQLQVVLNESGENMFAGKQLPCMKINFQVTEAEAERFSIGLLEGPFRVGLSFNIPLDLQDGFGNPARATGLELKPVIESSGLTLTYQGVTVKGHSVTLKDVIAKGPVPTSAGKNFNLSIKIHELNDCSQALKIRLLPGPAAMLSISPEGEQSVENGSAPVFKIQLQDAAGNPTSLEGRQSVICKLSGSPNLPSYSVECSSTGMGTLTGDAVLVKKMKQETVLTAKIDVQGSKLIKTVERKVRVLPSSKASEIRLMYQNTDMSQPKRIVNGQEICIPAGEMLEGLSFTMYDEADREVVLDDKMAAKIKVNWAAKVPKDMLVKGYLPNVKANTSPQESKYCVVSTSMDSVEVGFMLRSTAGAPHRLQCTCCGPSQISIGQPLNSEIMVTIVDKFGNEIVHQSAKVLDELKITGDGLKEDSCKVYTNKSLKTMLIKGIVFEEGTIGRKEIQVMWRGLKDYVRLDMVAGPPSKMKVLNYEEDEEIVVFNEAKFSKPLSIQLLDKGGNPSKTADIRVQLAKDIKLKLLPNPQPTKTNKDGIVQFGNEFTVSAPRGVYVIQPKAFLTSAFVLSGPKLKISVQPDPTRPSSMVVSYNTKAVFIAGESMTDFTVKIYAEDESLLTSAKASHVSLKLWKSEGSDETNLPSRTLSYSPDASKKSETGIFHFKGRSIPQESGAHKIMFVYYDGKHQLFSNVIHLKIEPTVPIALVSQDQPSTATVGNTKNLATRCIVRHLKLELEDRFKNHVTKGMNGNVNVEIQSTTGEKELPVFVGGEKSKTLTVTLAGGTCILQNVALQENSPGKDGCEYRLRCTINRCNGVLDPSSIQPYYIPFLFYNDAKKQAQMSALSKERDGLQSAIRTYKSLFETTEQLIEELKISVKEAKAEEKKIRDELRAAKVSMAQLNSVSGVEESIKTYNTNKEYELVSRKRRLCSLQTIHPNDPDVLGKIGHLALMADEDAARVLSWHMSSDMDCVVTMTTKKAKEIYNQTNGKQQVLPLDSIFRKSVTEWSKPLPHIKYKPNWRPPGNLMYARNLLTFEKNVDKCQTVFAMLLGDTLWIDTLDQANDYRKELVKYTNCPTILTRGGDRIRSNGKFGGLMNKAPPIEKLRGAVFGAPVPDSYHKMCSVLESLQNLKSAMLAHNTAAEELSEQMETINAPEMKAKYEECRDVEKQLQELEKKLLGADPSRRPAAVKEPRHTPDRNGDDGPPAKRPRPSPVEVNGNGLSSFNSPIRQSRRLASMTPVAESDGRKRLKKV